MKLVAKCLVTDFPYKCRNCDVNEDLKKLYHKRMLMPVCLKEYSYDNEELFTFREEIIGNMKDIKTGIFLENGFEITNILKIGIQKIVKLMDSMEIYDIILPAVNTLCGTRYIGDGTYEGGVIEGIGILPAHLEKLRR